MDRYQEEGRGLNWHPPSQTYRGLGCVKTPPHQWRQLPHLRLDPKNQVRNLLKIVDNSSGDTDIQSQGGHGACVAFALTAIMERITKKNGGNKKYSELFLYYTGRVLIEHKDPAADSGMAISDGLEALKVYGLAYAIDWPYSGNFSQRPGDPVFAEAVQNQVIELSMVPTTVAAWKAVLATGTGLVCGFEVHSHWYYSPDNAIINLPVAGDTIVGYHCVEIVGYDDTKSLFKFKNSWGTTFGESGYGYMPYDFLTLRTLNPVGTFNCAFDSAVITKIEMYSDGIIVQTPPLNFAEWGLELGNHPDKDIENGVDGLDGLNGEKGEQH